jgi:cell envelope-related function transcriptional attenuator common domain
VKKVITVILIVLVIALAATGLYIYVLLEKINKVSLPQESMEGQGVYEETEIELPAEDRKHSSIITVAEQNMSDIENILVFGLDRRNPDEASRSDTIMIASIDRKNSKVKITSLMRDMYVPIPGRSSNRINAAYAFGGPALAIKAVNADFSLNIKEYITVDFFGFQKIIDSLGGVDINVKENEISYCGVSKPGLQTLDGEHALAYARIRKTGNADYERTERQRRVLNEIYKKIKAKGVFTISSTVNTLLPYVETNMSYQRIISLTITALKLDVENIDQYRLPVDGYFKSQYINGMAVLVPNLEENKKLLHKFIYEK